MRLNYLANAIGMILKYIGFVILIPIIVAIIYKDYISILPFLTAGIASISLGYALRKFIKNAYRIENLNDIKKSEALFIVAFSWIIFGIVSGLPFIFYGLHPVDAIFEAVSGITTTGATILTNFDYPKTFFFWRSLTQWLGGLGIIVLFIAILPQFAVAGRQMFFAEAPGPTEDKITPRIRNTASALWKIYAGLTFLQVILLHAAGMPVFDAVCNSLSTLAAGGFSPNSQSLAGYNSYPMYWITTIFMFLAGASFIFQYKVLTQKKPSLLLKNEEFRTYTFMTCLMALLIAIALFFYDGYSIKEALTHAFYQVISITTSTGSASVDFAKWHFIPQALLFTVMFMGSCASSAGGGIKMTRWILVYKSMKNSLIKILHPNAILNVKVDNAIIPHEILNQTVVFVFFYFLCFAIGAFLITVIEQNSTIGITSSITALGNIGPGFGNIVGPMGSFSSMHMSTKIIMTISMLVGRLEIIPFLVMFQKDFWSFKESA
ncbi:TPA: TrkH family potassium uptake protein [Candidatus Scatenecus faecavium]|uniref:TrkH family potassium uptake protein n=1 Tax=Candidatus Scatenecus faecavium TaxID=2840915 RepID=A0A9D1FWG9_9BACT|nr:TrkH family potassium uptake protein [Candidatus Scatenecus faecavium]